VGRTPEAVEAMEPKKLSPAPAFRFHYSTVLRKSKIPTKRYLTSAYSSVGDFVIGKSDVEIVEDYYSDSEEMATEGLRKTPKIGDSLNDNTGADLQKKHNADCSGHFRKSRFDPIHLSYYYTQ